jgi:hypothetical protein
MWITHGAEVKQGSITVVGFDSFHLTGHGFQGFVPGNLCEFARSPCSRPFQGVEKTVGRIDPLTIGMAPKTHAGPAILIGNRLNSNNLPIPYVHLEIADASAMAVAQRVDNFVLSFVSFLPHLF